MILNKIKLATVFTVAVTMLNAQTIIPLYKGIAPNTKPCAKKEDNSVAGRVSGIINPCLYAYIPEKKDSAKTCVIICPGGGYARLAIDHEGFQVAAAFNKKGITAFVLKNRVPIDAECFENKEIVALMDVQQAIKLVRDGATQFGINATNIGVMGFSAGGHLASTIGTHYTINFIDNKENTSLRPDFLVLGYPVISFMDSLAHMGSRDNMLGKNPSEEKKILYSNELQVNAQTPPSFLVHAADDKTVKVDNSLLFFMALQKNKVASEMHIFQKGGHGFGLNNKAEPINWIDNLFAWMKANKFIKGDVE
ncbi:MAG: alpha/beta hydrolase [Pedobacter sp.]|nr:alpha/beta hydrolase [Chitinophagaceae bacterium]